MRKSITLFYLLCFASLGIGQSSILDTYIQEAINRNLGLKSKRLSVLKQESRIEQAKKLKGIRADINATYLLARGGRNIGFPVGDLFNPTYATLNQLTNTNQFPTNLENIETQLTPNNFLDAQFNISKPLLNSSIKYNQLIQEELIKLNSLDIEIVEEDLILQIKTAYYNYHKSIHAEKVLNEAKELLLDVNDFNRKLIKYDKATPDILYDVEFQIENIESQRSAIVEQQVTVKALFNLLLNREMDTEIDIDNSLLENLQLELESLSMLNEQAFLSRTEFKKIEVAQSVNELNKERINKEKLPTLGINAGVGMQVEEFDFQRYGPLFTVGLGFNMNIFDGGLRNKRIEEIQIDQEILVNNKSQLQQKVEIEILQHYYQLQTLNSQMLSEKSAVQFANKSYQATKRRYENDKAIQIELIQAQNRITSSELNQLLTQYDYLIKRAELDRAISKRSFTSEF